MPSRGYGIGQEALPEVRELSGGTFESSGVGGRPFRRSESGQEALA